MFMSEERGGLIYFDPQMACGQAAFDNHPWNSPPGPTFERKLYPCHLVKSTRFQQPKVGRTRPPQKPHFFINSQVSPQMITSETKHPYQIHGGGPLENVTYIFRA